jgi:hypothetical protein
MLLRYAWSCGSNRYLVGGAPLLAFAIAVVYGTRVALVTFTWMLTMQTHQVFNLGQGFMAESHVVHMCLQALAAQPDLGADSIARAVVRLETHSDYYEQALDRLCDLLGSGFENGDPTGIEDAHGNILPAKMEDGAVSSSSSSSPPLSMTEQLHARVAEIEAREATTQRETRATREAEVQAWRAQQQRASMEE